MKKILLLLVSTSLLFSVVSYNAISADGSATHIYSYESETASSISAGTFALSGDDNGDGWNYFGLSVTENLKEDFINEIKIDKNESGEYIPICSEGDVDVSISRVKSGEITTVTLTPSTSDLFNSIVITRTEGSQNITAVINSKYVNETSTIYRISVKFGLPREGGGQGGSEDPQGGEQDNNDINLGVNQATLDLATETIVHLEYPQESPEPIHYYINGKDNIAITQEAVDASSSFEIDLMGQNSPYNAFSISPKSDCALGNYTLKITTTETTVFTITLHVTENQPEDSSCFKYKGQVYQVGFGNTSEDGQTLHIDGGSEFKAGQEGGDFAMFMLGIGKVNDNNQINGTASMDLINKILPTVVVKDQNDKEIKNTDGDTSIVTDYQYIDKVSGETIKTKNYKYSIPQEVGEYHITISYKDPYENNHSTTYNINVKASKDLVFNVDDILEGGTDLSKLNTIFASKANLEEFIDQELSSDMELTFKLNPNKVYTGTLVINCRDDSSDQYKIYLSGSDKHFERNDDYLIYYTYDAMATIKGGVINYGGLYYVDNINFVKDGSANNGLSSIGSFSTKPFEVKNDITHVEGCIFNDYENGIYCYGSGLISGIKFCTFKNNDNAIYINSNVHNNYSDSLFNTFVDNLVGINIVKNAGKNPYDYVISKNYFFSSNNSSLDYKVSDSGVYFFINSYYGSSYTSNAESINNDNYRNPRSQVTNCEVVTGPLIRYPKSQSSIFGFNTRNGGVNKFNNGADYNVHTEELTNLTSEVAIDIFDATNQKDNGSLVFGGNQ